MPLVEVQNSVYNEGMRDLVWLFVIIAIALTATGCVDGESGNVADRPAESGGSNVADESAETGGNSGESTVEIGGGNGTDAATTAKIAFESFGDDNSFDIYVMNVDGTNPVKLTNKTAGGNRPAFSPDGTKIAFESYRDRNYEIYVMNADGTKEMRLTNKKSKQQKEKK